MPEGLGGLVRRERIRRGWTQARLATELGEGVDRAYISQIETGVRKWPQELLPRLSEVLDISEVNMAIEAGLISARYATVRPSMLSERAVSQVEDDPNLVEFIRRARAHPIPDEWWGTIFGIAENVLVDALKLAGKR